MQIPETPLTVSDLDLMKRLKSYEDGEATWREGVASEGPETKKHCGLLHSNVVQFAELVGQLVDKINAREMETFTMHDRKHALKVAHIMWHILTDDRRTRLTPPEIGLLVCSAFFHDVGMFLSKQAREARLDPASDLWQRLELDPDVSEKLSQLRTGFEKEPAGAKKDRILRRIMQAEEALLCQDTRERHATKERYQEILNELRDLHRVDAAKIIDVDSCLSHCGDTFVEKLVDICVSHNESSVDLVRRDSGNPALPRFQKQYPIGAQNADLLLVASALRLADILDFDRERTPGVIYYYFLPTSLDPGDDRSVLEWSKHLSISNWEIAAESTVFRGRCRNHIVHHAIVNFCSAIAAEISGTQAAWRPSDTNAWPFRLPDRVENEITAEGYVYVPYEFTLDDERIYHLLMGGAIYENPLDAVRELVQNAVDACKLKDALTRLYEPEMMPLPSGRILLEYSEPDESCTYPRLVVKDTGTGMDGLAINQWFLRVGRSYYSSPEFNRYRVLLRANNIDFAPVSEFGIGFLASFLLADRVVVETAMWSPVRGDIRKRTLEIHGPTRLIRMNEDPNSGAGRFKGTRVTLSLSRGSGAERKSPPAFAEIERYLRSICLSLPYSIELSHVTHDGRSECVITPSANCVPLDPRLEAIALHIPVADNTACMEGEIVLLNSKVMDEKRARRLRMNPYEITDDNAGAHNLEEDLDAPPLPAVMTRGGLAIGHIGSLPQAWSVPAIAGASLALTWDNARFRRYPLTDLSRSRIAQGLEPNEQVFRIWLSWAISNRHLIPVGFFSGVHFPSVFELEWLLTPGSWLEQFSALDIYEFALLGWHADEAPQPVRAWESGDQKDLDLWPSSRLCDFLLDLILPLVTKRLLRRDGRNIGLVVHVRSPIPGWREKLSVWRDFVTSRSNWSPFWELQDVPDDTLFYTEQSAFNVRYRAQIESLVTPNELPLLRRSLTRIRPGSYLYDPIKLTARELELLRRLQASDELARSTVRSDIGARLVSEIAVTVS